MKEVAKICMDICCIDAANSCVLHGMTLKVAWLDAGNPERTSEGNALLIDAGLTLVDALHCNHLLQQCPERVINSHLPGLHAATHVASFRMD